MIRIYKEDAPPKGWKTYDKQIVSLLIDLMKALDDYGINVKPRKNRKAYTNSSEPTYQVLLSFDPSKFSNRGIGIGGNVLNIYSFSNEEYPRPEVNLSPLGEIGEEILPKLQSKYKDFDFITKYDRQSDLNWRKPRKTDYDVLWDWDGEYE